MKIWNFGMNVWDRDTLDDTDSTPKRENFTGVIRRWTCRVADRAATELGPAVAGRLCRERERERPTRPLASLGRALAVQRHSDWLAEWNLLVLLVPARFRSGGWSPWAKTWTRKITVLTWPRGFLQVFPSSSSSSSSSYSYSSSSSSSFRVASYNSCCWIRLCAMQKFENFQKKSNWNLFGGRMIINGNVLGHEHGNKKAVTHVSERNKNETNLILIGPVPVFNRLITMTPNNHIDKSIGN